ncbi:MAG TPA: SCP2 sterol-binding domain-containing protein [Pseudonocardiaceae bacterium]|jgi:putative sterol carrier protein|nr:SCP2 sterol-binding domain-containing protein [Pseudonocardiaceae bacterium]
MADTGPEAASTDQSTDHLKPARLVEFIECLDGPEDMPASVDFDAIARRIDPRAFDKQELSRLLARMDRLARDGARLDLSLVSPMTFARLVTNASADQVAALMTLPALRKRVLDEVFRRMVEHFRHDRGSKVSGVVHWRLTGGAGVGGYDRYETIIENGTCVVNSVKTRFPRVTITLNPADFMRLITGNASAPVLFMTGGLRVKGDLAFAAGLTGLFRLPHV